MTNSDKKKNNTTTFRSYSKNLSNFLIKSGLKVINEGVHHYGVRVSPNNGKTWDDFVSIDDCMKVYGDNFSKKELTSLRDDSLAKDSYVKKEGTDFLIRKRVRFFKEFAHSEELNSLLKEWNETKPK